MQKLSPEYLAAFFDGMNYSISHLEDRPKCQSARQELINELQRLTAQKEKEDAQAPANQMFRPDDNPVQPGIYVGRLDPDHAGNIPIYRGKAGDGRERCFNPGPRPAGRTSRNAVEAFIAAIRPRGAFPCVGEILAFACLCGSFYLASGYGYALAPSWNAAVASVSSLLTTIPL